MPVGEICNRVVVYAQRNNSTLEAAKPVRQHHVGDLLELLAEALSTLAKLAKHEQKRK